MKKLLVLSLTLIALNSTAQYTTMSYSTAAPLGVFKEFVGEYSWQGFEAGYQHKIGESFTFGFHWRFTKFYEKKDKATYEFDNGAITGTTYAYSFINNFNFTLNYMHETGGPVTPYIGFAAGPAYLHNLLVVGIFEVNDYPWRFSMTPQIGAMIEVGAGVAIDIKANYNYIPLKYDRFTSIQSLGIELGITWSPFFEY